MLNYDCDTNKSIVTIVVDFKRRVYKIDRSKTMVELSRR